MEDSCSEGAGKETWPDETHATCSPYPHTPPHFLFFPFPHDHVITPETE